jgi:hypothetical protein
MLLFCALQAEGSLDLPSAAYSGWGDIVMVSSGGTSLCH